MNIHIILTIGVVVLYICYGIIVVVLRRDESTDIPVVSILSRQPKHLNMRLLSFKRIIKH